MKATPWIVLTTLSLSFPDILSQASPSISNRFEFLTPQRLAFRLEDDGQLRVPSGGANGWLKVHYDDGSTNTAELGSRVVVKLYSAYDLKKLTAGRALELSRTVRSNVFILQAPDAATAAREAHRLAALPEVAACYPVMQRQAAEHGPYTPRSSDLFAIPYFVTGLGQVIEAQWWIENREGNSVRRGIDLNVMAAWPYSAGQGVTVAIADSGLELNHPDLITRLAGAPHFNFDAQSTNAPGPAGGGQFDPLKAFWTHGTSIGGLVAAEGNNGRGITGVAPQASLASWVIYTTNAILISDEKLMDMYQYAAEIVGVQNHSWGAGNGLIQQRGPTLLEQVGIENAITLGRHGLGTILVRAAGNDRPMLASANDDGYMDDPQVITVAAVTQTGRATSYSEPGACVLLGAPGGGGDSNQGLLTTDLVGNERGINAGIFYGGDLADYRWGVQGFIGTSASAPLVCGVAALVLSVNPNLGYRDMQHILLLSGRHWDTSDPDIVTNGAGLLISHNVGFGVPNAGHAAQLARSWSNRPPLVTLTMTDSQPLPIPDDGLRLEVVGSGIPPALTSIHAFPTFAPNGDQPTALLPLVDAGVAAGVPAVNLTNKGALILRDATPFAEKISNVAKAGATFAVIYDSAGGGGFNLGLLAGTDYSPIPAVFIGNSSGESLRALFQTNATALARLHLLGADKLFHINGTLLCEQVGVRVQSDHPVRGDLRITILSPQGTRSVLQHFSDDSFPGPADWTYWTTHHFMESSAGDWTVTVSDEYAGATGSVLGVTLTIRGTQIADADHDGLADEWEMSRFGTLAEGPLGDPDGDGLSNAREQITGTDPESSNILAAPNLSRWGLFGSSYMRLSWPSAPQYHYEVRAGTDVNLLDLITNVPGGFPETEWFDPFTTTQNKFFQVRALQSP